MKLCELVSEPDVLVILVNYELNARLVIKLTLSVCAIRQAEVPFWALNLSHPLRGCFD